MVFFYMDCNPPPPTNNLPYSKRQSVDDGHQTKNFTQNLFLHVMLKDLRDYE